MKASPETVKVGDTIIVTIDVFNNGHPYEYDGHVWHVTDSHVSVKYLDGHSSRDDDVTWDKVHAKLDKSLPWVSVAGFRGPFQVFEDVASEPNKTP